MSIFVSSSAFISLFVFAVCVFLLLLDLKVLVGRKLSVHKKDHVSANCKSLIPLFSSILFFTAKKSFVEHRHHSPRSWTSRQSPASASAAQSGSRPSGSPSSRRSRRRRRRGCCGCRAPWPGRRRRRCRSAQRRTFRCRSCRRAW